ncbi:hypothetical protein JOB18_031094 [Solea senegalensis]|uniref:Secreted protein n=1 Tax=Solea senegalensis TaxID=28829 RepID=A0AAV6Q2B0_SOLSE|nr:hypothetical protein JOB18_031094 [Solea senegalensis]
MNFTRLFVTFVTCSIKVDSLSLIISRVCAVKTVTKGESQKQRRRKTKKKPWTPELPTESENISPQTGSLIVSGMLELCMQD